jgi:hypothetical protein
MVRIHHRPQRFRPCPLGRPDENFPHTGFYSAAGLVLDGAGRTERDDGGHRLLERRYVLHDRDTKFCREFRETLAAGGVKCLAQPARSPNLNSYAECWVRSVKEECLSRLILFGESSFAAACGVQFSRAISPGAEPSGQGQSTTVPYRHCYMSNSSHSSLLSRAAQRLARVLQPSRMSIFAIRPPSGGGARTTPSVP